MFPTTKFPAIITEVNKCDIVIMFLHLFLLIQYSWQYKRKENSRTRLSQKIKKDYLFIIQSKNCNTTELKREIANLKSLPKIYPS